MPCEPTRGKLGGGEGSKGGQGFRKVLEILGEPPVSFDHPATRQYDDPLHVHRATASAQMSSSQGTRRRILSRTVTRIGRPSLLTRAWIAALHLLAGIVRRATYFPITRTTLAEIGAAVDNGLFPVNRDCRWTRVQKRSHGEA